VFAIVFAAEHISARITGVSFSDAQALLPPAAPLSPRRPVRADLGLRSEGCER
jgi:hypothetical protein